MGCKRILSQIYTPPSIHISMSKDIHGIVSYMGLNLQLLFCYNAVVNMAVAQNSYIQECKMIIDSFYSLFEILNNESSPKVLCIELGRESPYQYPVTTRKTNSNKKKLLTELVIG